MAGGLVAVVGGANALVVDAASFAIAGAVLALVDPARWRPHRREPEADVSEVGRRRTPPSCARAGRSCARDPVLMGIGVMVAMTNLLDLAWSVVLVPVWAQRQRLRRRRRSGCCRRRSAAPRSSGSVAAAAWAERLPRYRTYLIAFLVCGVPRFVVLALDSPLWAILVVAVVGGFAVRLPQPGAGRGALRADPGAT